MVILVQDIITLAMSGCGAARIGELPAPHELKFGVQLANIMLAEWSIEHCMLRQIVQEGFPLVLNQASYTIGDSASYDFHTDKPISITGGFIRDEYGIDTPLNIVSRDTYDSYQDKQFSAARPISLYYDPGAAQQASPPGYGTIYLYYMPDGSVTYTLYINSDKYLTEFSSYSDQVTFESAYYAALVANLTAHMFRHFHGPKVPIPNDISDRAMSTKNRIMALNNKVVTARMDVPGRAVGLYNIYTGVQTDRW